MAQKITIDCETGETTWEDLGADEAAALQAQATAAAATAQAAAQRQARRQAGMATLGAIAQAGGPLQAVAQALLDAFGP